MAEFSSQPTGSRTERSRKTPGRAVTDTRQRNLHLLDRRLWTWHVPESAPKDKQNVAVRPRALVLWILARATWASFTLEL
jgi:hypothetical protein